MNKVGKLNGKNILFLQGPMGNFFKKLDTVFRRKGAHTYKIGFNIGDWFFSHKDNYVPYRTKSEEWPEFIEHFLEEKKIDKIFLFGDCRYYQAIALEKAYKQGIDVFVFEEGYLRPHYVTMEKFGVNDYSRVSRDPGFYERLAYTPRPSVQHAYASKTKMVLSASLYYLLSNLFMFRYPYYRHHRDFSAMKELFYGLRGAIRKVIYPLFEQQYLKEIQNSLSKKYFFVPLQTYNDFQILQHSEYGSIEKFIIEVLESFSQHAQKELWLIFKHHPVDRGRKNYKAFIMEQAESLGIEKRILVFHDVHLPTCLENAKGTVTINSTVGLTSIAYNIPTITLGKAIYNIKGLTNQKSLKEFWKEPKMPDAELYHKFSNHLIQTTQLNGSFYGRFPVEFETDEMYI